MGTRVLVVEDEEPVRGALTRGLKRCGFDVTAVKSAAAALGMSAFDISLIDLGLPDQDGIELCKQLRLRFADRPIIVVTGRDGELDVVDALGAGADDYVTKPFSLHVLVARIRRHLSRAAAEVVVGSITIDRAGRRAWAVEHELDLTAREFDLLTALISHAGEPVSSEELIRTVWDAHWSKSTHTLAVHISALRSKLRAAAGDLAPRITTVTRLGYRLDPVPSKR